MNMCFRHPLANDREAIIVMGGRLGYSGLIDTEIFDIKKETWTLGPNMPRASMYGMPFGTKIY